MNVRRMQLRWPVIVLLLLPLVPAAPTRPQPRPACRWVWTPPETLLYRGATFSLGGLDDPPHVIPFGNSLAVVGSRAHVSWPDADTHLPDPLAFVVARNGTVSALERPAFIPDRTDVQGIGGNRGSIHLLWTFGSTQLGYASTNGARYSAVDTVLSPMSGVALFEGRGVAATGDDVVTALPVGDSAFSGLNVATRAGGRWSVERFPVEHEPLVELSFAVEADDAGATVAYVRPRLQKPRSPSGSAPGLYVRRRRFDSSWGPETLITAGDAYSPMAIRTPDGTLHLFWRRSATALYRARSRDGASWIIDSVPVPHDIQNFDAAPEAGGLRVVMQQADDPNDIDQKYSRILSFAWTPAGASPMETLPATKAQQPTIISVSPDTSIMLWTGERGVTFSSRDPKRGPSRYVSIVPATILARHVADPASCRVRGTPVFKAADRSRRTPSAASSHPSSRPHPAAPLPTAATAAASSTNPSPPAPPA